MCSSFTGGLAVSAAVSNPIRLTIRSRASLMRPVPPLTRMIGAATTIRNGLPEAMTATPISSPRGRDPASPISIWLGSALYQR